MRRWLHEMGWVWKRAKRVARDDDPQRIARLARMRLRYEHLRAHEVMVFAEERDIHLLPKVGAAWMLHGTQDESMTPGTNETHSLAGALHLATGKMLYWLGPRTNTGLFRDLLTLLDTAYRAAAVTRISVVVDHDCMHKAKAVHQWVASHPCFALRWLPTYGPRANPIERVFGDVHDKAPGITNGNASAIWCRVARLLKLSHLTFGAKGMPPSCVIGHTLILPLERHFPMMLM